MNRCSRLLAAFGIIQIDIRYSSPSIPPSPIFALIDNSDLTINFVGNQIDRLWRSGLSLILAVERVPPSGATIRHFVDSSEI